MTSPNLILYGIHVAMWSSFCAARLFMRGRPGLRNAQSGGLQALREYTAAYSRTLLVFHMCGIAMFYVGVAKARLDRPAQPWVSAHRSVGVLIIVLGATLIAWAIASLHSWRFRAKLDEGHQLATTGAFKVLRHPIYAGMNLAALGTLLWVSTPVVWIGVILIVLGSDLRARAEESLLQKAFGSAYTEYSKRTKRFIPCVY
ncbi:MAG TPA: isoprenylcysteine carboxylmethyltransferase family protein [Gemmatimonadaceae bacterium]|jgi:protein-S-isoprenylcysteine O-methyltransferase Ste14|nr:isoprenylcysteine carboxylmethyltransferase family protein [Gemmatimonadaceae bacterium]